MSWAGRFGERDEGCCVAATAKHKMSAKPIERMLYLMNCWSIGHKTNGRQARQPFIINKNWSGRLDSNQRPHAPQACALPGCATSRLPEFTIVQRTNCQTCNTKTHRKQSRKRHKKHSLRLALRFVLLQQR